MASVLKLKTDIKKLKAAIASKATSGAIKTKLRGKLTSLENELDKLQPNKRKPKTTGPKNESALVRLAKKRRTNQGLSTSKSDIERDAIRPAKKAGKRTSASGNTYYEYRDNRVDNRQPPKKYRKLADGGNTSDFDELIADKFKMQEWYENFNDGLKNLVTKKYVTKAELNKFDNYSSRRRIDPYEKYGKMSGRSAAKKYVDDNKRYDKMADGGMMASGGMFSTKEDNEVVDKAYRDKLVEYIYKKYSNKSINGFELSSGAFDLEGNFLWENKAYDNLLIYVTPFFTPDNDISYEKYVDEDLVERKDQPYKLTGDIEKDADTYIKVVESKTKKYAKGKMADGGKTQGYDDKKDESLGMTRGKLSLKDFVGKRKQKEHSRRDDARFEERGMMDHGGYMPKGGQAKDYDGEKYRVADVYFNDRRGKLFIVTESKPSYIVVKYKDGFVAKHTKEELKELKESGDLDYIGKNIDLLDKYIFKDAFYKGKMADGGYMAKGDTIFGKFGSGRINKNAWVSANYIGDSKVTLGDLQSYLERNTSEKFDKDKIYTITRTLYQTGDYTIDDKKEWKESIIYRKRKMADGGYMAKGGKTKDQEVVRGYFEDEAYEYGSGGEVMYLTSTGTSQKLVTDKSSATPMFIMDAEYYIKSNPKNSATMVAEKIDETLPDRVGKNYIVKITKKHKMDHGGYMADGGETNLDPYDLREKASETLLKLAQDIRNVMILEDSMARNSEFENNTTRFFENTLNICENANKEFNNIKDKYYKTNYADGGMVEKLRKEFSTKELDDNLMLDGYKTEVFDYSEEEEAKRWVKKNSKDNYVVPYENDDDNYIYVVVPKNKMADGGSVAKGNYEMLMSQAKEVMHHAEELMQVVKPNMDIEAWVVSKAERATTDLSDITHYLDGLKMAMGGMVKNNAHKVNG